jgi:UDP-2,3-diacylglucosamine pyrophosphatase LpxH
MSGFSAADRPLLVCISDIHLTDALHGSVVSKADQFERFWTRIQAARGHRPAQLCFVGDVFDLVRSPAWLEGRQRPYHPGDNVGVTRTVERIVTATLAREAPFFAAIRRRVQAGELEVHYVQGNHDRLLRHAKEARRAIGLALTGRDEPITLHRELAFPDHGVLAYHGHLSDPINFDDDGDATIGDAIGSELILRFPQRIRAMIGADHPAIGDIDDIDDVRPVYAVPAWVRQLGAVQRDLLRPIGQVWSELVDEFLGNDFVSRWLRKQHKTFGLDLGKKLRLLLELSRTRIMAAAHDERLTQLYKVVQHSFDGKMSALAGQQLSRHAGLRYVVNGHSHFAAMQPLGRLGGRPAVYFNTGTWRTVHQIGHDLGGRPSFVPYDAMSYLVMFPDGDTLGRDYEWWTGALVARNEPGHATAEGGR